jgi:GT2 family glycosyltransferase
MIRAELVGIINSFNRLTLLKKALPALVSALEKCPFPSAIVVFDAGSTDGSIDWLAQFENGTAVPVHVISPSSNEDASFSAGINAACAFAAATYPEVLRYLFYETDNWIAGPEPILQAVKLLEEEDRLAAVGFRVIKHSGEPAGFGCTFPTVLDMVLGQQASYLLGLYRPRLKHGGTICGESWAVCDTVFTSPLLVRRKAWEDSGGMDAGMFPFSDCDVDWSWRLKKKGWSMAVLLRSQVVHDNEGELSSWSAKRVVEFHRARLRLLRRHAGNWVELLKPLLLVRHLCELAFLKLFGRNRQQLSVSLEKRRLLISSVLKNYELDSP